MALAGHALLFEVSASVHPTGSTEVDGIKSVSFGPSRDMLEETDFSDSSGAHKRFAGLKDGAISVSGDYEAADTGQALIRTSYDTGALLHVQFMWEGTTGQQVPCRVESYEIGADFDGNVTFSASMTFNDVYAAV